MGTLGSFDWMQMLEDSNRREEGEMIQSKGRTTIFKLQKTVLTFILLLLKKRRLLWDYEHTSKRNW